MATSATAMRPQTATRPLSIEIGVDLKTGMIVVNPRVVWVSVGSLEEVTWVCLRRHEHGKDCFTAKFEGPNGSPFTRDTFWHDGVRSGPVREGVRPTSKLYEYTLTVPGFGSVYAFAGVEP